MTVSILTLLLTAVWMDLRSARISNRLILFGLLLGATYRSYTGGARGLLDFLTNAFLPVILFFLMYRIKALGAGDIKLLSMLSGFLAKNQLLQTMWYVFTAAAAIGLLKLLRRGILTERLKAIVGYAGLAFTSGRIGEYDGRSESGYWSNRIHFSAAVLLGYVFSLGRCFFA